MRSHISPGKRAFVLGNGLLQDELLQMGVIIDPVTLTMF